MLNRVAVFPTAPVAAFLTLLLELLLGFGIGKAKEQLDTVVLDEGRMVLLDDALRNFSSFESGLKSVCVLKLSCRDGLPGKADLLANPRGNVSTDLGGDSTVGEKVLGQILWCVSRHTKARHEDEQIRSSR